MNFKKDLKGISLLGAGFVAVIVALFFILTLGFITHYYPLFYDGNSETYDLYMQLQNYNDFIFDAGLVFAVLAVLMIPFDVHKEKTGVLKILFLTGFLGYTVYVMNVVLQVIPRYVHTYTTMDLSFMEGYEPNTIAFTLCYVLLGLLVAGLLMLLVKNVVSFFKLKKTTGEVALNHE